MDGRILHRDTSETNIIINDGRRKSRSKGVQIYLDLGKEIDAGPNGARHCTGTMEFMAIEVLEGISQPQKYSKCWLSEAAPPTAEVVLHPY